jgi:Dolichyl-phosphate-mannose-protein mannosyltransferase
VLWHSQCLLSFAFNCYTHDISLSWPFNQSVDKAVGISPSKAHPPEIPSLNAAEIPTDSAASATSTVPTRSRLLKPAAFWFAVSALALVVLYARLLHLSFDGDFQGWASSSCMTMAHVFNQLGALHTHFVPIQNNLPLGSDPDVYLHWPPLFPLLLSSVTSILGDRESSGRLFALVISLASAIVVAMVARRLYGIRAALLSGFFFLAARATYEGARAVLHQPLAIFFGSATILFFLYAVDEPSQGAPSSPFQRNIFGFLGLLTTVCTMLTAWDPAFIPLGLLLSSLYLRNRAGVRLAAFYFIAGILTFVAVQTDYILTYPALFRNQFATVAFRAGLHFEADSSTRLHSIVDQVHYLGSQLSFAGTYSHALRWVFQEFDSFVLLGGCLFLALWLQSDRRHNSSAVYLLGGLCFPWILFFLLMRNYVSIHPFALVLAAPFLAIASGFVLDRIWSFLDTSDGFSGKNRYLLSAMVFALPLITLYPLFLNILNAKIPYEPPQFQNLSAVIERNTTPAAVTLSPAESAVVIYYSDRHVVRGIETPELLRLAIPQARADFPGSPLFFALQDADRPAFYRALPGFVVVARQGDSTLYSIP